MEGKWKREERGEEGEKGRGKKKRYNNKGTII